MKLAKKVLACVIAVALISTLAISAFAAASSFDVSAPETVAIGDKVTVTVALKGAKGLENLGAALDYNADVLDFVSATVGEPKGFILDANKVDGANTVSFGGMSSSASAEDTVSLVTVVFTAKAMGKADIKVYISENDIGGVDEPEAVVKTITVGEKPTNAPVDPSVKPSTSADPSTTEPKKETPKTGDAGIAVAAGLVVLAGAAFVASKKTK